MRFNPGPGRSNHPADLLVCGHIALSNSSPAAPKLASQERMSLRRVGRWAAPVAAAAAAATAAVTLSSSRGHEGVHPGTTPRLRLLPPPWLAWLLPRASRPQQPTGEQLAELYPPFAAQFRAQVGCSELADLLVLRNQNISPPILRCSWDSTRAPHPPPTPAVWHAPAAQPACGKRERQPFTPGRATACPGGGGGGSRTRGRC